jgi:Carboxypeptidase regulatory-like domain
MRVTMLPPSGGKIGASRAVTGVEAVFRIGHAMKRFSLVAITILLVAGALAQDDTAILKFLVLRDYNGKPVRNASVVMHPVNKKGKQARGGFELKADAEGRASFDGVPYGKLRVQVLAPGFQTFGQDYEVKQPEMEITVKLKRPQGQYSIYENQQNERKEEKKQPPNEPNAKPQ